MFLYLGSAVGWLLHYNHIVCNVWVAVKNSLSWLFIRGFPLRSELAHSVVLSNGRPPNKLHSLTWSHLRSTVLMAGHLQSQVSLVFARTPVWVWVWVWVWGSAGRRCSRWDFAIYLRSSSWVLANKSVSSTHLTTLTHTFNRCTGAAWFICLI
jgi:hypothetical protein